jgi:hypothetical protein
VRDGGHGCLQLFLPSRGTHTTLDFHGRAPAATRAGMWEDRIAAANKVKHVGDPPVR